jgi:hypothetical protein
MFCDKTWKGAWIKWKPFLVGKLTQCRKYAVKPTQSTSLRKRREKRKINEVFSFSKTILFVFNRFIAPDGFRISRLLSRGLYFENFDA